jgi:ABC-type branched-subunit amino acid transport system ATPase component
LDALSIKAMHGWYGKSHILQGVDIVVPAGEVVGLLGRNGAGKTTLLKAIMGQLPRMEGEVSLYGQPLQHLPTDARARAGIAYMSQDNRVFPDLSVAENIKVAAASVKNPRPLAEVLGLIGELRDHLHRAAGRLSGGQQQLVALARCMTMNARMLMMDEPTEGVMPQLVERIGQIIQTLAHQGGVSVLLVEQNLGLSLSTCKTVRFMEKGRVVGGGPPAAVTSDGSLERVLGVQMRHEMNAA